MLQSSIYINMRHRPEMMPGRGYVLKDLKRHCESIYIEHEEQLEIFEQRYKVGIITLEKFIQEQCTGCLRRLKQ